MPGRGVPGRTRRQDCDDGRGWRSHSPASVETAICAARNPRLAIQLAGVRASGGVMHSDARGSDEPPPPLARRLPTRIALLIAALVVATNASAGSSCPAGPSTIPLVPGTTWTYAGNVRSTVFKKESAHLIARHVTLRMEVRAAFRRGNTVAA